MKVTQKIAQMNKKMKIALGLVALVLVSVVIFWYCISVPNKNNPDRLPNIPKEAIWKGATDEGFWIDIVDLDATNRTVRVKIYTDYNGELALDANFKEQSKCEITPFTKKNILNNIIAFSSKSGIENRDEIWLKNHCSLKMIRPAYGGIFGEQDK